jgi:branched-chain amino acid transport system permease protein
VTLDRDPSEPARARSATALLLLAAALLAGVLLLGDEFAASLAVEYLINLILVASLNTIMGVCGQISIGHAGFFGLGAYASGVLSAKLGVSPWLGLPVAVGTAALGAALLGVPALRLRGHYLAMATLGGNAILVVLFNQLVDVTGGPNGLLGVKTFALGSYRLDTQARVLPLVWLAALIVMLGLLNLDHSRVGRALRAIAGGEIAANSLGVDTFRTKLTIFVLTASMAGLAGGLYVHANAFASPETFSVSASVLLVVMVALGGSGRYWGAPLGALVMTLVPELLRAVEDWEMLLFGLCLIGVLLALPGGLVQLLDKVARLARPERLAAEPPRRPS